MTTPTASKMAELQSKLPPGPLQVRPEEFDDWGLVRDANGKPIASFTTQHLISEWHKERGGITGLTSEEWHAGPPVSQAMAEYFCMAHAVDWQHFRHIEQTLANITNHLALHGISVAEVGWDGAMQELGNRLKTLEDENAKFRHAIDALGQKDVYDKFMDKCRTAHYESASDAENKRLREALESVRSMLVDLRDKHLNHTAAVVRALVQHRIEAVDKALSQTEDKT
jgi:hypothetical protein